VQTYLEELGDGDPTKNHVRLYRELLHANALSDGAHLPDAYFEQGAVQLALGLATDAMLPEVIGFNLGYEQLPLHLLITAYELNELGIDPYYFQLHVTVDNADSGHARKAVDAVLDNAARYDDAEVVQAKPVAHALPVGLGIGTSAAIGAFDPEAEVLRILSAKARFGAGAHSDYCRIEGRTVNEWLAEPQGMAGFLDALRRKGWIATGVADPSECRFWQLLSGERAEMFGVFSSYELQVIHDWIRGAASADGASHDTPITAGRPVRIASFRARQKLVARRLPAVAPLAMVAPGTHWQDAGLAATRDLAEALRVG
ncbi:MAG: iron-containing redox enzyme family protein, partial [Comamonadaceae bacterium]